MAPGNAQGQPLLRAPRLLTRLPLADLAEKLVRKWVRVSMPVPPTYYEYDMTAARRDFGYAPELTIEQVIDEALLAQQGGGSLIPTKASL